MYIVYVLFILLLVVLHRDETSVHRFSEFLVAKQATLLHYY